MEQLTQAQAMRGFELGHIDERQLPTSIRRVIDAARGLLSRAAVDSTNGEDDAIWTDRPCASWVRLFERWLSHVLSRASDLVGRGEAEGRGRYYACFASAAER